MLVIGTNLSEGARREALAAFVYRWTHDNIRRAGVYGRCPVCGVMGGEPSESPERIGCRQHHPTVPLVSDAEWLAMHAFHVTKDGRRLIGVRGAVPAYMAKEN